MLQNTTMLCFSLHFVNIDKVGREAHIKT